MITNSFFWNGGFETMFMTVFAVVFLFILGTILVSAIRGIGQWNKNNHSPRLIVEAVVVSKRADVSMHHHTHRNDTMRNTTTTSYYVTFQVESGDRMELELEGMEFGLLAEGDRGRLTFQGTRYLGFERIL